MKVPNSAIKYEMNSGKIVDLKLTMMSLYNLRNINKKSYENALKVIDGTETDTLNAMFNLIYACYLCGDNQQIPFNEFVETMNQDITYNAEIFKKLLDQKKTESSQKSLNEQQKQKSHK